MSITKNSHDYDENYMKVKFDSDDNLLLNETVEISIMTKIVENNKQILSTSFL